MAYCIDMHKNSMSYLFFPRQSSRVPWWPTTISNITTAISEMALRNGFDRSDIDFGEISNIIPTHKTPSRRLHSSQHPRSETSKPARKYNSYTLLFYDRTRWNSYRIQITSLPRSVWLCVTRNLRRRSQELDPRREQHVNGTEMIQSSEVQKNTSFFGRGISEAAEF